MSDLRDIMSEIHTNQFRLDELYSEAQERKARHKDLCIELICYLIRRDYHLDAYVEAPLRGRITDTMVVLSHEIRDRKIRVGDLVEVIEYSYRSTYSRTDGWEDLIHAVCKIQAVDREYHPVAEIPVVLLRDLKVDIVEVAKDDGSAKDE